MEPTLTVVDPNNEDCSSSDNRSLLSIGVPAMETDRFGFILGTGSPVGTEGPPPEVVRQREAKWLNIISQWDRILLKKTNKVKEQCRKGIPASLRARCWPLLCRATERMSKNSRLYQTLDSSPALQSWVDVIERDIDRQFPFHEMFLSRDGHGQQGLFRVLKAYTQFRPDEGYCQGQGPVAAVLLMNMPAEEAFWCLVQISEQCLPGYYSPLLEGVLFDAGVLNGVLRRVCPAAHRHLHKHDVEPLMFATDWLMCLYTRHLPFNTLLRVWDLFFCYGVRVLFQVAVVLVRRVLGRQDQREKCEGQMETLERLRGIKAQLPQEDDSFIEEVCSVPLTGRDLERETERELKRWRKEHPSSTFDPRCRCHGYRAAWLKGRESEEQQERAEREKGNLSLPLLHSPSSLSPSLRKRWKRGSRVEAGEREEAGAGEEKQEKLGKAGEAVQLPTRAQSIREAVPFSSAHRATAGPKSETLPDDTGTELRLPDQAGQAERVVDQEETQPTGTDPTLPGGHLISPKDQGGPGQMPPPAEHCPSDEKCSGVYRPRRAPCGKASRSRTLSQDTFRDLNYTGSDTTPTNCLSDHTPQDISKPYDPANQDKTKPCPPSDPSHQLMSSPLPASNQTDPPRRFALFRMLRGDHQKDKRGGDGGGKDKKASSPKITVPTILIQDFSDGVGLGMPGDGLSSKERRKKRREQERRKREEEKARKKEKEMENEKDRERKKPQTRGKSFHAHSAKCDVPPPGDKSSKTPGSKRNSAPFLDTYF
ncbi:hypothetical protein COCON_G00120010 [Conger conger]|uniref:Rab-GAP TBC domain-containing protein n=1 Tax=Conger conger TaxID=82655 RepID=A0A9Q1HYV4_CONCO|nr:hypothetical protein COCON_G00120010 [Conger conger]